MAKTFNQSHSKDSYLLALSNLFERAGYYGVRGLLVLYLIGETFEMSNEEALTIYGVFTSVLLIARVLGAVLGDLVLGNKNSMIIGVILQTIGTFCLVIPSIYSVYVSLLLMILGGALYGPNLRANFGKQYLEKDKLLESGFALLYLIVNIGAFLGILIIGIIGEDYGYQYGFVLAGILFIIALIPVLLSKEEIKNPQSINKEVKVGQRLIMITLFIIFNAFFWGIYELTGQDSFEIQNKFLEISAFDLSRSFYQSLNFYTLLPVGLLVFFYWWLYPTGKSFFKLTIGFILGALSFGILLFIPEVIEEQHVFIYITSIVLLSIAEIIVTPVLNAVITRFGNHKYLAIIFSLVFIPTRLLLFIVSLVTSNYYTSGSNLGLTIGLFVMIFMTIVVLLCSLIMMNLFKKPTS